MAALCADSLIRQGQPADDITVWTDHPDWFKRRGCRVRELSAQTIAEWKGRYRFSLRLKILMMQEVFSSPPDGVQVFSDADIFWRGLPDVSGVEAGTTTLMHAYEPNFGADILRLYNEALAALYPGQSFKMYNSGVLGFPRGLTVGQINKVLRICDHVCDSLPRKMEWAEQIGYSVVFQRDYRIQTVEQIAYHYWGYNQEIARLMRGKSLDEWATLSFEQLEHLNQQAEALFNSPLYRWQNRIRKLQRSWRKTRNQQVARKHLRNIAGN